AHPAGSPEASVVAAISSSSGAALSTDSGSPVAGSHWVLCTASTYSRARAASSTGADGAAGAAARPSSGAVPGTGATSASAADPGGDPEHGGDCVQGAEAGDAPAHGLGFAEPLRPEPVLLVVHRRAQLGPGRAQTRGVGVGGEEGLEVGVDDVHEESVPSVK